MIGNPNRMHSRYSEIFSVNLAILTFLFCLNDVSSSDPKETSFKGRNDAKQKDNVEVDLTYNKDAEDVASFKELIGEARNIFKDSEDVCNNHHDNGDLNNLKLLSAISSISGSSASIVLLGAIFNVIDVVPEHEKFTDKLSWVQLECENYRMDLLLTAKDRPFQIRPNDKFAVTIREDSKFVQSAGGGMFRPGSFDAIMNGTLYKTLISDSSVHPTKTLDILYITFGDSFLKIRASGGQFRYFKNCKQLYILFQKLAFK